LKDHLLATPMALRTIHDEMKERNPQNRAPRTKAGQALPGETQGALHMAQGELGERKSLPRGPILSLRSVFGRKYKSA
jgi:large subunit ribosomal protein L17